MAGHLLEVDDLKMHFHTRDGVVKAVDGVSYTLDRGETLGVVGESGSGKSVTALTLMGLVPMPPGRVEGGDVRFKGRSLITMKESELREIRGNEISMIFQDPMTSLNPVYRIGRQIGEPVRVHKQASARQARERAIELLGLVGIPHPEKRVDDYPHQFSGGMRQRAMIAMALACDPDILIADEPTTALDVTIQAQILELMQEVQTRTGAAIIMITHDLGVVADIADRRARHVRRQARRIRRARRGVLRTRCTRTPGASWTPSRRAGMTEKSDLCPITGQPPSLIDVPSGVRLPSAVPVRAGTLRHRGARAARHRGRAHVRLPLLGRSRVRARVFDRRRARGGVSVAPLLKVADLVKHFPVEQGVLASRLSAKVQAVDGVSFEVEKGETLGLVGESGCGQVDDGPLHHAADPADVRLRRVRRARRS